MGDGGGGEIPNAMGGFGGMPSEEKSLRIEYVRLDRAVELIWQRNKKLHALDSLAASFKLHGFRDAPAFDANLQEGGAIVDGNGRIEALAWMYDQKQKIPIGISIDKEDGMWCVPIQFGVDAPSQAAAESYALDCNNLVMAGAEFTAWDMARLWDDEGYLDVLKGLAEADLMPVSVDLEDFVDLMAGFNLEEPPDDVEPQIDRAAELQEKWGTALGQCWILGDHRLVIGDCTDPAVVEAVMRGEKADAVVTDPPYGVSVGETNYNPKQVRRYDLIANDDLRGDEYEAWIKKVAQVVIENTREDGAFYFWSAPLQEGARELCGLLSAGLHIQGQIIWVKPSLILGQADYQWQHEICWYVFLKGKQHQWHGGRKQTTVWEVGRENDKVHPTQKPVELFERAIQNSTLTGEVVCDPFVGSGTCIVACERLGRKARTVELDPGYAGVCLQRFFDLSGIEPVLTT